jgi:SAM-dependent methyltransferase
MNFKKYTALVFIDCPICKACRTEVFLKKGSRFFPVNVSVCKKCGFVFLNPRWNEVRIQEYYSNEYDVFHRPKFYQREDFQSKNDYIQERETFRRLEKYLFFNSSEFTVLDVGGGSGEMLEYFQTRIPNFRGIAIEPSISCQILLKNKGFDVLAEDVLALNVKNSVKIDLIIMRQSLEHMNNPLAIMTRLSHILSPRGIIYISVPDLFSFESFSAFSISHQSYFSEQTLQGVCIHAGLKNLFIGFDKKERELFGIFSLGKECLEINSEYEKVRDFLKYRVGLSLKNRILFFIKYSVSFFIPYKVFRFITLLWRR